MPSSPGITDYCTAWPDGWPSWLGGTGHEWALCCKAHDEFYAGYDGWLGYLGAHYELAQCVGGAMGAVMWLGLVSFGSALIVFRKNKLTQGRYRGPPGNR